MDALAAIEPALLHLRCRVTKEITDVAYQVLPDGHGTCRICLGGDLTTPDGCVGPLSGLGLAG
jgi:hypothetical protein